MPSMFRFRRHPVLLVFAVVITILVFRYSHTTNWGQYEQKGGLGLSDAPQGAILIEPALPKADEKQEEAETPTADEKSKEAERLKEAADLKEDEKHKVDEQLKEAERKQAAELKGEEKSSNTHTEPSITTSSILSNTTLPSPAQVTSDEGEVETDIHPVDPPARQEAPIASTPTVIYWEEQKEHFPVPTESIIKLPTGSPVVIPQIQYRFKDEAPDAKAIREKRQSRVKDEFKKAWKGYREKAWLHDEVSPVTGGFRDPFSGWAATLVDSLDSLWIMGLKEEFDEAAKAVDQIDFTTSTRNDIQLFETTIRYLGGLLGAYEVSGKTYKNLLSKAEELAGILIGAFDTPNRMPVLYYQWKPASASQPHRASQRSDLAELGSLSLEFTRLAQLTKEPRYYDAVARVTDALAEFQNRTKLPGVFPPNVDATGCNTSAVVIPELLLKGQPEGYKPSSLNTTTETSPKKAEETRASEESKHVSKDLDHVVISPTKTKVSLAESKAIGNSKESESPKTLARRSLDNLSKAKAQIGESLGDWDCVKQGLDASMPTGFDRFSMGGNQDSTYEYFPKQYLLLSGRVDTYRQLYLNAMEPVRKWMIYRPMLPGNPDILFAGAVRADGKPESHIVLAAEVEHLTCFIGGMFGMGSKIFDLKDDLEMAKKLTDGCVWAYGSMPAEVMAESAALVPCASTEGCAWNETVYHQWLDPTGDRRDQSVKEYLQAEEARKEKEKAANALAKEAEAKVKEITEAQTGSEKPNGDSRDISNKSSIAVEKRNPHIQFPVPSEKPLSHEEYVENHIKMKKLPPGYVSMRGRGYILRPEAIESVWYMYRITGDPSWQAKGWKMFEAIIKATSTTYGHSAIQDVTADTPSFTNEEQSFWMAETLKYFYLLFSTPDTINLDEWVLNTEAHPFRREV